MRIDPSFIINPSHILAVYAEELIITVYIKVGGGTSVEGFISDSPDPMKGFICREFECESKEDLKRTMDHIEKCMAKLYGYDLWDK